MINEISLIACAGIASAALFQVLRLEKHISQLHQFIAMVVEDYHEREEILEAEIEELKRQHASDLEAVRENTYEEASLDGYYQGRGWKSLGEP